MTEQSPPTLDCQDCGRVLRRLSPAEAQQVADNPYNFIALCSSCQRYFRPPEFLRD